MPNERDNFLADLEPGAQEFGTEGIVTETNDAPAEDTEDKTQNRRERRTQAKLQAERESNIFLAAKLEAITEAQKFSQDAGLSSYEEKALRIYGNETPEATAASNLLVSSLKELKAEATREAIETLRAERAEETKSIQKEEQSLNEMVEDIEDETGQTLDAQTRRDFFSTLEKLSPKDSDGNITAYADPDAVWELMQSRKPQPNTRAKDLASRSMNQSGATAGTNLQDDVNSRFLKENGLI